MLNSKDSTEELSVYEGTVHVMRGMPKSYLTIPLLVLNQYRPG